MPEKLTMRMTRQATLQLACLVLSAARVAAEVSEPVEQKMDTLLQRQDQLIKGQQQILQEVLPQDMFPKGARAFTFSLPAALVASAGSSTVLAASFSWFPPASPLEFVLPLYLRDDHGDEEFRATLVDLQGRLYLSPRRSGLYVVGGVRSAWLTGREQDSWEYDSGSHEYLEVIGREHTLHKMGFYGGAGWRAASKRFYWNTNLVLGRYVGETEPELLNEGMMGGKLLLDAEFFKFGVIF
jgi:hypothetical protein